MEITPVHSSVKAAANLKRTFFLHKSEDALD